MHSVFGCASLLLCFEEQRTSLFIAASVDADLAGGKTLFLYHEMKNKTGGYLASNRAQ